MHFEVIKFVNFLEEIRSNHKSQLTMIGMRVEATIRYFEDAPSEGRKIELRELIQEYTNLFAHVYLRKPLREFTNFIILDGTH